MINYKGNVTVTVAKNKIHESLERIGIKTAHSSMLGLDSDYSWVDLYLQDQAARVEIGTLQREITGLKSQPLDLDGLKQWALELIERYKQERLRRFRAMLANAQNNRGFIDYAARLDHPALVFHDITAEELEQIFSDPTFAKGMSEKNLAREIKKRKARIDEIYAMIAADLSPSDRWLYTPTGNPIAYPQGCRWSIALIPWRFLAAHCNAPVNYLGYAIEDNAEELKAWHKLGLDKVNKERERTNLMTPTPRIK